LRQIAKYLKAFILICHKMSTFRVLSDELKKLIGQVSKVTTLQPLSTSLSSALAFEVANAIYRADGCDLGVITALRLWIPRIRAIRQHQDAHPRVSCWEHHPDEAQHPKREPDSTAC
jgi:hypothetical protein